MIRWEYKTVDIVEMEAMFPEGESKNSMSSSVVSVLSYFNYAGNDGWEFCLQWTGRYFFKRAVQ